MNPAFEKLLAHLRETERKLLGENLGAQPTIDDLARAAAQAVELADDLTGEVARTTPPERALACQVGCAWCCSSVVSVSVAEVAALIVYLRAHRSPEELTGLSTRVGELAARRRGLTEEEWNQTRTPCPLLTDGACSAYEARPLPCRGYNSYSVDACTHLYWQGGGTVPMFSAQHLVHGAVQAGLGAGLAERRAPEAALELVAALAIGLELPEARWLDAGAWTPALREAALPWITR